MTESKKAMLIVISGPSGVGKGTICKKLFDDDPDIAFSVSATTRFPRPGEKNGIDYFFVSEEEFNNMKSSGELLEDAEVHGHKYGTPLKPILETLACGKDVILDIDTQGALNVMEKVPECISIFILPPSWDSLRKRLEGRHTETAEEVKTRLDNARREVMQLSNYSYAIVNQDGENGIEQALSDLKSIVNAERHKTIRFFPSL